MVFEKVLICICLFFEVGMIQFGGQVIFFFLCDIQFGCGELIGDSVWVMLWMFDGVMICIFVYVILMEFVVYLKVLVINGLFDDLYFCQLFVDMQIFYEYCGSIQGKIVVWIGDGNNMCNSYIEVVLKFDFQLCVVCFEGYELKVEFVVFVGDCLCVVCDLCEVVVGVYLVSIDVWVSMGQEDEVVVCIVLFCFYQVNVVLFDGVVDDVLFMYCLLVYCGEEISEELLDDLCLVVWDQVENCLYVQKVFFELLIEYVYYV